MAPSSHSRPSAHGRPPKQSHLSSNTAPVATGSSSTSTSANASASGATRSSSSSSSSYETAAIASTSSSNSNSTAQPIASTSSSTSPLHNHHHHHHHQQQAHHHHLNARDTSSMRAHHHAHYSSAASSSSTAATPTSYVYANELTHYLEHSLVPSVVPMPDEYEAKEQARIYLEKLANEVSPGAKLLPFGSMANGFALKNSDMDLCCVLAPDAPVRNAAEMVDTLGRLVEKETDFHVKMLPRARIPIIKLTVPPSPTLPFGMACDIGFENRLALENTRLLLTYAMIDPRLRTMVLFLKVWTKRRKINNPYRGTLSSYGFVLLVIHFLTHVKTPPVLPNLQRLPPLRSIPADEREFDGHDIFFFDDLEALPHVWQTSNVDSVGELLIDFYRYYSKDFMYNHHVLSIRSEYGLLTKESKGWNGEVEYDPEVIVRDLHKLCIEDPFQLNYNVARTVTRDGLYTIRGEFMRAYRLLAPHRANDRITTVINDVCEEREDTLVIHPPSGEARASARRRSAPSPRIGPTHFGSNVSPAAGFGTTGLPAVPPIPPMSDFRIWSSMNGVNRVHGTAAVNGSALIDDSAPTSPILGFPSAAHPISTGHRGPRRPPCHSSLQPAPHHALPRRPSAGTGGSSSTTLGGGSQGATLERRVSWDGSGSTTTAPNGVYDLHRFFQNQPGDPSSSPSRKPRSTMTAPSSPDLSSASTLYHTADHSTGHAGGGTGGLQGGRTSLSTWYNTHSNVGPRFGSRTHRNGGTGSGSAYPHHPGGTGYPAAPASWGYAGSYPLGASPNPGPIFPEEDREATALENSITFGNFPPAALSSSSLSSSSARTTIDAVGYPNAWRGQQQQQAHQYAYPISSSSSSSHVDSMTHSSGFGISPARSIATFDDTEQIDPTVVPAGNPYHSRHSTMEEEEDLESTLVRGRRLNGLPPLLPASDEWDLAASRPRQRGRSVPHVRLGPDGRESILFGEIQVTLPKPVVADEEGELSTTTKPGSAEVDDDDDDEDDEDEGLTHKDVSTNPAPQRSIPSLTTSPPTPLKVSNMINVPSTSSDVETMPKSPELIPVAAFATPSTMLNNTNSATSRHSRANSSSSSSTPTPPSPRSGRGMRSPPIGSSGGKRGSTEVTTSLSRLSLDDDNDDDDSQFG